MPHAGRASDLASGEQSYFAIFDLPPRLTIDIGELERAFYARSRKLHPDLYVRKSAEEQVWSLRQSSLLNDAYRTLKDPIARTEYLLELEGVRRRDENKRDDASAKQSRVPADLLEEVFEFNMQLDEMRTNLAMGEDDPELRSELIAAQQQFTGMLEDTDGELRDAWGTWDAAVDANDAAGKDAVRTRMAALLDRRSYLRNLVRDVAAVLEPAAGAHENGAAIQTGA